MSEKEQIMEIFADIFKLAKSADEKIQQMTRMERYELKKKMAKMQEEFKLGDKEGVAE